MSTVEEIVKAITLLGIATAAIVCTSLTTGGMEYASAISIASRNTVRSASHQPRAHEDVSRKAGFLSKTASARKEKAGVTAACADRGKSIFDRFIEKYPGISLRPFICGVDTKRPHLLLTIPETDWDGLCDSDQESLALYVKSLIPAVRSAPDAYLIMPKNSPIYNSAQAKATALCDECWAIGVGRLLPANKGVSCLKRVAQGESVMEIADLGARTSDADAVYVYAKAACNIRKGPGTNYPVVRKAPHGEKLKFISRDGSWYKLQVKGGVAEEEWVHSSVVSPPASAESGKRIHTRLKRKYRKIFMEPSFADIESPSEAHVVLLVPETEWSELSRNDKISLALYAQSLIPVLRMEPEKYFPFAGLPETPLWAKMYDNAKGMCDDCWAIIVWGVSRRSRGGREAGDVYMNKAVVMGDALYETKKPARSTLSFSRLCQ